MVVRGSWSRWRWESFTSKVVDVAEEGFDVRGGMNLDFETHAPVSLGEALVRYMQTHTLDVVLWYVDRVTDVLRQRGGTVTLGVHPSIPEGSARLCCARLPLSVLLVSSQGASGYYSWTIPLGVDGEEEEIGSIQAMVKLMGNNDDEIKSDGFRENYERPGGQGRSLGEIPEVRAALKAVKQVEAESEEALSSPASARRKREPWGSQRAWARACSQPLLFP